MRNGVETKQAWLGRAVTRAGAALWMALAMALAACGGSMVEASPQAPAVKVVTYLVAGVVKDGAAAAVAGATVHLGGGASSDATTDAAGSFRFSGLTAGHYTLAPSMEGRSALPSSLTVEVVDRDVKDVTFTLSATQLPPTKDATFTLASSIGTTGESAEGIAVALEGAATLRATTDAAGRVAFTGLHPGRYTVTPSASGRRFHPLSQTFDLAADTTGPAFTLVPAQRLSGVVRSGGSPLPEATVTLTGAASLSTSSDASGAFSFQGLEAGSYRVAAAKKGYRPSAAVEVAVAAADVTGVELALARAFAVSGAVAAASPGGVTVALAGPENATATTDAAGHFSFDGLAEGSYVVTPAFPGQSFDPPSAAVALAGADAGGLVFTMGHTVSGALAGILAGGSAVALTPVAGGPARTVAVDGAGAFAFTGVPDGACDLSPVLPAGLSASPASRRIAVAGADVKGVAFTSGYTVSGNAAHLAGVAVSLAGPGGLSLAATTDASGAFAFQGLQPGAYTVAVSKAGVDLQPPSRAFTVVAASLVVPDFQAAHAIAGRVNGIMGGQAPSILVRLASGAIETTVTTDASGAFRAPHLLDGTHLVSATLSGYDLTPSAQWVSLAGADQWVEFTTTYAISGSFSYGGCGGNLSGASVAALRNGQVVANGTITDGASPSYRIAGLFAGTYTVRLTAPWMGSNCAPGLTPGNVVVQDNVTGSNFTWSYKPQY